jgi:hypothetical protein
MIVPDEDAIIVANHGRRDRPDFLDEAARDTTLAGCMTTF